MRFELFSTAHGRVKSGRELHLLDALHIAHAGYLAHAADNALQVFNVGNVHDNIDGGVSFGGVGFDVADVGVGVTDNGSDLLQHARAVVAKHHQFDGEAGLPH